MSTDTVNYGFKKDNEDEFYNVNVVNDNLDKIDTEMKRIEDESKGFVEQVADNTEAIAIVNTKLDTHIKDDLGHVRYGGRATGQNSLAITLANVPVVDRNVTFPVPQTGFAFRFIKNDAANVSNVTIQILYAEGKTSLSYPIYDSQGKNLTAGALATGGLYTIAFNGAVFFLQGSGSGVTSPETNRTTFSTPGTHSWVVPENVTRIVYRAWGAGGGGGGNCRYYQSMGGGGGGAGAYISGFLKVTPGTTLSILVGEGGTGGSPNTVSGQANLIYAGVGGYSGVVGGFYAYGGGGGATPENRAGYINGGAGAGATVTTSGSSGGVLKINPSKNGGPQAPAAIETQIRGIIASFSGGDGWYTENGQGGGGGGAPSDGAGGLGGPTMQTGKIFTEGAKGGVGGPMGQSGEVGNRGSGGGGAGAYNGSASLFGSRGGHGFVEIVW